MGFKLLFQTQNFELIKKLEAQRKFPRFRIGIQARVVVPFHKKLPTESRN